ncbi:MAG: hypothetical protein ACI9CO_000230 [Candidatus Azotimanducaceae bacterium]|jgi:hypothetical protein
MTKRIWITWENQRRNRTLSQALSATLFELDYNHLPKFSRYIKSIFRTISIIHAEKPHVLFVQNPSIVLTTLALIISKYSKFSLVVDAHNGGINPLEGKSLLLRIWADNILKHSPITIVSNGMLKKKIQNKMNTSNYIAVLPDPIPTIPKPNNSLSLSGEKNVLFICTWAGDEPYFEVIKAAEQINNNITIYITGNHKKAPNIEQGNVPKNVQLTGFISNAEFDQLLWDVDIIMDLTTREDCLVCGAYEAIAVEKPLILSNMKALKTHFPNMEYTENTAADIARSIDFATKNASRLATNSKELKTNLTKKWQDLKLLLDQKLPH